MTESMQILFTRLQDAKFSGVLKIRFEAGEVVSARLSHFLGKAAFASDIPLLQDSGCQKHDCHCHDRDRQQDLF
jgi:hypothetical protein